MPGSSAVRLRPHHFVIPAKAGIHLCWCAVAIESAGAARRLLRTVSPAATFVIHAQAGIHRALMWWCRDGLVGAARRLLRTVSPAGDPRKGAGPPFLGDPSWPESQNQTYPSPTARAWDPTPSTRPGCRSSERFVARVLRQRRARPRGLGATRSLREPVAASPNPEGSQQRTHRFRRDEARHL